VELESLQHYFFVLDRIFVMPLIDPEPYHSVGVFISLFQSKVLSDVLTNVNATRIVRLSLSFPVGRVRVVGREA
jgi:hypothetical protein